MDCPWSGALWVCSSRTGPDQPDLPSRGALAQSQPLRRPLGPLSLKGKEQEQSFLDCVRDKDHVEVILSKNNGSDDIAQPVFVVRWEPAGRAGRQRQDGGTWARGWACGAPRTGTPTQGLLAVVLRRGREGVCECTCVHTRVCTCASTCALCSAWVRAYVVCMLHVCASLDTSVCTQVNAWHVCVLACASHRCVLVCAWRVHACKAVQDIAWHVRAGY